MTRRLIAVFLAGAAVSVALGVYGHEHNPTGVGLRIPGFSSLLTAKAWLTTVAVALALVQLGSALVMYGRVPGVTGPTWISGLHRWSGRVAFLIAVPVAWQCLYVLGYQTYSTRVLIHSLLGCAFFGAFTAKMLVLRLRTAPGWVVPVAGGLVFSVLVGIWLTSALWLFDTSGLRL